MSKWKESGAAAIHQSRLLRPPAPFLPRCHDEGTRNVTLDLVKFIPLFLYKTLFETCQKWFKYHKRRTLHKFRDSYGYGEGATAQEQLIDWLLTSFVLFPTKLVKSP